MKVSQLFCHSLYFTGTACTCSLGFELGTTENKSRKWPELVSNLRVWRAGQSATLPNYFTQHFRSLLWYLNFLFIPPDSLDDTVLLLSTSWMSPIISFTSLTASSPNLPYKWANCYSEGMNSNKTTSVIRQTREKVFYHLPNTENMGPTMAVCLKCYYDENFCFCFRVFLT